MLCYVMWNLFTVGNLQFYNYNTIASLEANQNRPIRTLFTQWKKELSIDIKNQRRIRGCSYGGELAGLGRLARLREISPCLHNSYKNINVFIWKGSQPALVRSHLILPRSHLCEKKIFYMKTRKWPARQGGKEFSWIGFVLFFKC